MGSPSASLLEVTLATRSLVVVGEPGAMDAAEITGNASKFAVAVVFEVRVTRHAPVPAQPPLQPRKAEFVPAVAVSVTTELLAKLAVQVAPQLMPAGELVTVPVPAPIFTTERLKFTGDDDTIVRIPDALVSDWPSGFVTVMVRAPAPALLATVIFSVILVGFEYVTLLTVTLPPLTDAEIWFANPAPGSKKPEPFVDVPLTMTLTLATPW